MDRNSQNRSAPLDSTGKEASRRIDEQIELIAPTSHHSTISPDENEDKMVSARFKGNLRRTGQTG
ncbi:hypothetical protein DFA_06892 [Cavenderia fasciculata]|uniref:Uncharacterized protein n=1 Tax=Cavenderia fasciculata TaxID=261658 RepID=F4PWY7_CACFS|nr:uncharacterized protein DFA_06892 [Cavenderia fasciculata]EGG19790.1 hypothetical protein DFA_06892 [Cavenderia fasciculata]|eukprot:XP_004358136.1 hypothetical protein DFA_06892 [Cavenderia fasciculata]